MRISQERPSRSPQISLNASSMPLNSRMTMRISVSAPTAPAVPERDPLMNPLSIRSTVASASDDASTEGEEGAVSEVSSDERLAVAARGSSSAGGRFKAGPEPACKVGLGAIAATARLGLPPSALVCASYSATWGAMNRMTRFSVLTARSGRPKPFQRRASRWRPVARARAAS